jgi:hypothetical protein
MTLTTGMAILPCATAWPRIGATRAGEPARPRLAVG